MKVDAVTGIFFFGYIILLTTAESNTCNCKPTENGTFLVCNVSMNATNALNYCLNYCNTTLASIKSPQEFIELERFIGRIPDCTKKGGKSKDAFYIGAQDKTEGEWRWIDDNTLLNETYSNWNRPSLTSLDGSTCNDQPDQQNVCPDNYPVDQDYAVLQMCDEYTYGTWFDVIGNIARPFICKISQIANSRKNSSVTTSDERTGMSIEASANSTSIQQFNSTVSDNGTAEAFPTISKDSSNQTERFTTTPVSSTTTSAAVTTTAVVSMPIQSSTEKSTSSSAIKRPTSSRKLTETHPATQSASIDKYIGRKDDDYLRQLFCMILSMLKPSDQCDKLLSTNGCERPNQGNGWNPILYFEGNVSRAAAEIFFSRRLNDSYSKKVGGIRLEIVPIWSKAADGNFIESLVMPMENSCSECDEIEIHHSNMHEFDKVFVGARFECSVLEGLGIYNSSLETTADDDRYTSYVSPRTSVLSGTVFKNTEAKGVHAVSKPAKLNFNIADDDSVGDVFLKGSRSRLTELKRKCVFMKANGKWSDSGCTTSSDKAIFSVQCNCNHTTAFAVMVSLNAIEIPDWLETVLLIAEIIGILFLVMTLAMLLFLKQMLKKGRIITQTHLCLALLLMHISMVCTNYATPINGLCVTLAALSHFFMVSSAMWMLNEGIVLYRKTGSGALNFDIHKFKKWLIFLGWVLPFLYAVLCLAIGMGLGEYLDTTVEYDDLKSRNLLDNTTDVNKYQMCWLSTKSHMVVAAIVPVAITLLLATCILVWVSKIIWGMNKQALDMMPSGVKKNHQSVKSTAKAVALLIPVLGLPWILAFMVNINGAEVVFTAVNGITNGLQGLVLFIIYIIVNRETRTSMKRKLTRSFSSANTHSHSALPSSASRKPRDTAPAKVDGTRDKPSTPHVSPPKEASAISKV